MGVRGRETRKYAKTEPCRGQNNRDRAGLGGRCSIAKVSNLVSSRTYRITNPPIPQLAKAYWEFGLSVAHLQTNLSKSDLIVIYPVRPQRKYLSPPFLPRDGPQAMAVT